RSRRCRASPALAGTRSGAPVGPTHSSSKARTRRMTAFPAGWAVPQWTRTATSASGTASSTQRTSSRASATRAGSRATFLGQMTLGEGAIVNGTASQTHTNSRWGDYTSLNVDPVDDCTFWYVNEYYTVEGAAQAPLGNGWQTRIASFRLPGCWR